MHPAYTLSRNSNEVVLETSAFMRMHKLRLLQLIHVQLNGSFQEFPTEIRWLCWHGFPFNSLPNDFPSESLVVLEVCYSSLKQVWEGEKVCHPREYISLLSLVLILELSMIIYLLYIYRI